MYTKTSSSSSTSSPYLHPDYVFPLPTTLDAKQSPLALLAQTCSSIGSDVTSPVKQSSSCSSSSSVHKSEHGDRKQLKNGVKDRHHHNQHGGGNSGGGGGGGGGGSEEGSNTSSPTDNKQRPTPNRLNATKNNVILCSRSNSNSNNNNNNNHNNNNSSSSNNKNSDVNVGGDAGNCDGKSKCTTLRTNDFPPSSSSSSPVASSNRCASIDSSRLHRSTPSRGGPGGGPGGELGGWAERGAWGGAQLSSARICAGLDRERPGSGVEKREPTTTPPHSPSFRSHFPHSTVPHYPSPHSSPNNFTGATFPPPFFFDIFSYSAAAAAFAPAQDAAAAAALAAATAAGGKCASMKSPLYLVRSSPSEGEEAAGVGEAMDSSCRDPLCTHRQIGSSQSLGNGCSHASGEGGSRERVGREGGDYYKTQGKDGAIKDVTYSLNIPQPGAALGPGLFPGAAFPGSILFPGNALSSTFSAGLLGLGCAGGLSTPAASAGYVCPILSSRSRDLCGKRCISTDEFLQHLRTHSPPPPPNFLPLSSYSADLPFNLFPPFSHGASLVQHQPGAGLPSSSLRSPAAATAAAAAMLARSFYNPLSLFDPSSSCSPSPHIRSNPLYGSPGESIQALVPANILHASRFHPYKTSSLYQGSSLSPLLHSSSSSSFIQASNNQALEAYRTLHAHQRALGAMAP